MIFKLPIKENNEERSMFLVYLELCVYRVTTCKPEEHQIMNRPRDLTLFINHSQKHSVFRSAFMFAAESLSKTCLESQFYQKKFPLIAIFPVT